MSDESQSAAPSLVVPGFYRLHFRKKVRTDWFTMLLPIGGDGRPDIGKPQPWFFKAVWADTPDGTKYDYYGEVDSRTGKMTWVCAVKNGVYPTDTDLSVAPLLPASLGRVVRIVDADGTKHDVAIYLHMRERRPDLRWFVPAFWAESVESHGLRTPWPADLDLSDAPSLVRNLAARGLWLEQERIVLDHRLLEVLESTAQPKAGEDPG